MTTDRGEATVVGSVAGAIATGVPIAAGVILTTDNVSGVLTFLVALFVGLTAIGTAVGKVYARWRASIEASIARDDLLRDLCDRVARIEDRQIHIMRRIDPTGH